MIHEEIPETPTIKKENTIISQATFPIEHDKTLKRIANCY